MDIGRQRRIIQVEPEPLTAPVEAEPVPSPAPELAPIEVPEPATVPAG